MRLEEVIFDWREDVFDLPLKPIPSPTPNEIAAITTSNNAIEL